MKGAKDIVQRHYICHSNINRFRGLVVIMGGVGSGGYKNSPGDIETHSAWTLMDPVPGTAQVMNLSSNDSYVRTDD